jgi:site-specific recombinase XerD
MRKLRLFTGREGPLKKRQVQNLFGKYANAAGIQERSAHALRHSMPTHLLDAGADLAFVKDWLGHANIQNTTIYARLTTRTRDAEARKVLWITGWCEIVMSPYAKTPTVSELFCFVS